MNSSRPPDTADRIQVERLALRRARPGDAAVLTRLALRSKGYWGYNADFLEACREELTLTPERLGSPAFHATLVEHDGKLAGYYALHMLRTDRCELNALFVDPPWIGKGIGRRLLDHAKDLAQSLGAHRMTVQSDPGAAPFYLRAGARVIGFQPSGSIPDRDLPVLQFVLQDTE